MPKRHLPKLIHIYNKLEGKTLCGADTCHNVVSEVSKSNCIKCISRSLAPRDDENFFRRCKFCGKSVTNKSPYFNERAHVNCYRKQQKIDRDFKRYAEQEKKKNEYEAKKNNS